MGEQILIWTKSEVQALRLMEGLRQRFSEAAYLRHFLVQKTGDGFYSISWIDEGDQTDPSYTYFLKVWAQGYLAALETHAKPNPT